MIEQNESFTDEENLEIKSESSGGSQVSENEVSLLETFTPHRRWLIFSLRIISDD